MSGKEDKDFDLSCPEHLAHVQRIKRLETDNDKQWEAIEKLQNRLPLWATLLIAGLGTLIGWLLKAAAISMPAAATM